MKILLVTHIYPPAIDGGSKVITKIGQYLESQGHQVLVLTTNCFSTDDFVNSSSQPITGHKDNVLVLPVYKNLRRPLKLVNLVVNSNILTVFQKGPIFKIFPFIKSLLTIRNFHPNLIIAGPLPTTVVLYASFISKITHSKLLINASFHPTDPAFSQKPLINCLKNAEFIWTLTDFETNYFHRQFNIPFSKMINIGNGIDKSLLIRHLSLVIRHSLNLLFIGSFSAHKGLDVLIDSFANLPSNTTLTLAGQKTLYFPNITSKIKHLPQNIQTRIKIISNFPQSQLSSLIDSCTVLISPSTQESFGLVLLEAWARSKPVIAADIPASSELINKTNGGLIFKTNDSDDLTKKINILLKDSRLQKQLGRNGFKYVQSHATWDRIGQALWSKISSS